MLAYVAIKPLDFEGLFRNAIDSSVPEELLKFSAPLEQAFLDLKNWVITEGMGRPLSMFGGTMVMEMPMDKISVFTGFLQKFEYTTKTVMSIGIGTNQIEALMAMYKAEAEGATRVVLFTDNIEESSSFSKAESDPNIHQDLISNLGLDEQEQGEGEAPENPTEAKKDPKTDKEEQSAKQKIVETLMMLKEHAPTIAQLKELNPKAFEAVKKVVDSMILMAQRDLTKTDKLHGGLADNIPKSKFNAEHLEEGISHELEHTNDREIASEIARDHLQEDPNYYKKIKELEKVDALGKIKDGKIKIQARDMATRKVTGEHWHQIKAGQALGPTGHSVSSLEPNKE